MKTVFAIIVVLCSVAGWTPAQAQSQLTGTLTDTSGAVVPAATLPGSEKTNRWDRNTDWSEPA